MFRLVVILLAFFIGLAFWLSLGVRVSGSHNIKLPGVPDTPAIHDLWATGEWTYCLDPATSSYPNFRSQVQSVAGAYRDVLGIQSREVGFGTPSSTGCEIQKTSPSGSFCSSCAADVAYSNWPVVERFKLSLGFVHWESTDGHEDGHITGLHEQYQDFGSIQCTYRTDTVMDCGSYVYLPPLGVWYPQPFDVANLKGWLYPPRLGDYGMAFHEGRPFAWYGGGDPHPARADYVAIMYYDPNGAFYYSGIWTAVPRGWYERPYVYCIPGRHIYANQQMSGWPEASWNLSLRNDVWIGMCP